MSLTAEDKTLVKKFWEKIAGKADDLGSEALSRMIIVYPQTKTYFAQWPDLGPGSPSVKKHGKTIMKAVGDAVTKMDNLIGGLQPLSDLLRVDPGNFKILSHNLLVTFSANFPSDFTTEVHAAVYKFLAAVSAALANTDKISSTDSVVKL
ncbi:hypothetical protein SKAU_G00292140 [Synaphobranchus kaupii]|uniref:Globin domain-containing protein n=1 Tax=Synaphobranchus kaupii TaxID=118154 RepID=A0A9Q1ETZ3_SYNKA|nr:hypothetical protein SKAU_G00292140 [Synaphobranchus kaupii]